MAVTLITCTREGVHFELVKIVDKPIPCTKRQRHKALFQVRVPSSLAFWNSSALFSIQPTLLREGQQGLLNGRRSILYSVDSLYRLSTRQATKNGLQKCPLVGWRIGENNRKQ